MGTWIIITGEYPPGGGGVAAYTQTVARTLVEAGDAVHVIAPGDAAQVGDPDIGITRLPRGFTFAGIRKANSVIKANAGARVLVQYVPHAFGWKAMNFPLCMWLARMDGRLDVMFHEVACEFTRKPLRHNVLACAHALMARMLCRAADRIFVSTTAWVPRLESMGGRGRDIRTLPIPSSLPDVAPEEMGARRATAARVGHFGVHRGPSMTLVKRVFGALLHADPKLEIALIGSDSEKMAVHLRREYPTASARILGTGALPEHEAAGWIASCDLMLQPYPDGATLRRTSVMAALALGVPVVTNSGPLTEEWWQTERPAVLAPVDELVPATVWLLSCPEERAAAGARGRDAYRSTCSPERIVATLRETTPG
jgi:glycosyltransferase involved in cell wall biosynthesis